MLPENSWPATEPGAKGRGSCASRRQEEEGKFSSGKLKSAVRPQAISEGGDTNA